MKAAVLHAPDEPLTIEDIEIDAPRGREVLIRTVASGVCHSDLHHVDGLFPLAMPAVLGHEAAGIVEAIGPQVEEFRPGDHVIACLSAFCGRCDYCFGGRTNLCPNRPARPAGEPPRLSWKGERVTQFLNLSAFAEQMLVHENGLVKIREDFPLDKAALIGCSVTTGVGAVIHTAKVETGATVAVFGVGGVGLNAIQGAVIANAGMIIAVDVFENKLAMAREFGATHVIDASSRDAVEAIRSLTGDGVDYSFEAIGLAKTAAQAFNCLRPGGTATIMGMIPAGTMVELDGSLFLRERKIQGSNMGSNRFKVDMPHYVELALRGRLKLDELITRRGRLEDVNDAFRAMRAGEVARTVFTFD
jgi:S-(hydroxymethyl)glutathione dehydrogenase/alcohol dehydrogenase